MRSHCNGVIQQSQRGNSRSVTDRRILTAKRREKATWVIGVDAVSPRDR